jgi:hypothetical protein
VVREQHCQLRSSKQEFATIDIGHKSSVCAAEILNRACRLGVIRVDIAMSAAWSAIHNTGHYHVRLRPVCLPPSCTRSANNGHSRRSSRIRASVDRATHDARSCTRRVGIPTATNLRGMCCQDAEPGFGLIGSLAKDRAGSAERRPPTERWQLRCGNRPILLRHEGTLLADFVAEVIEERGPLRLSAE